MATIKRTAIFDHEDEQAYDMQEYLEELDIKYTARYSSNGIICIEWEEDVEDLPDSFFDYDDDSINDDDYEDLEEFLRGE